MLTSTTRPKEVIIATLMRPQRDAGVQVRFNVSQVDEWVSKGKIRSGDTLHRAIRRRERDILPRLDGIAFVSDFVGGEVSRRIPDAKRVPAVVISSLIEKTDQPDSSSPRNDLINIGTSEPHNNQQFLLKVLAKAKKLGKQYRPSVFDASVMGQRLLSFSLRSSGAFGWGFNSFSES